MDKGNKLDFTGQHIYVGMDIHIYDISRFPSLDKLASYAGLVPDIKSSGET